MIEDKEKYRNECAKRSNRIFELQGKKDFIDKLLNEFGDVSIMDLSLAFEENLESAQKAYDDFTREETETLKKIDEMYDSGKILDLIADGYDRIDMVNLYLSGQLKKTRKEKLKKEVEEKEYEQYLRLKKKFEKE